MAAISISQVLEALRAQRTALLAEDPVDRIRVAMVTRTILDLRGGDPDPQDVESVRWQAFVVCRDMEADPATFDETLWAESIYVLVKAIPDVPEEFQAGTNILAKNQVLGLLRRTALNPATELDSVRAYCFDQLRRRFDMYLDEDPRRQTLLPVLTELETAALTRAELAERLNRIRSLGDVIRRPSLE